MLKAYRIWEDDDRFSILVMENDVVIAETDLTTYDDEGVLAAEGFALVGYWQPTKGDDKSYEREDVAEVVRI